MLISRLRLRDYSTWVRLGCSEAERASPQEVRWSFEIEFEPSKGAGSDFTPVPNAMKTDRLDETVCYAKCCDALKFLSQHVEYATVEKLGLDGFRRIKEVAGEGAKLKLQVHKVHPPVPNLSGGVVFEVEE